MDQDFTWRPGQLTSVLVAEILIRSRPWQRQAGVVWQSESPFHTKGDELMKRILLAFLLMLPAMTAVNKLANDPMPPCWPCPVPPGRPPADGTGTVISMPASLR